jgi:hypothetical protein
MTLIETNVTGDAVRIRLADHIDPAKASEWLEFQAPVDKLPLPPPQDALERRFLAEIQAAALRHARGAIAAEIRRLEESLDGRH